MLELVQIAVALVAGYAICFYFTHEPLQHLYHAALLDMDALRHEVKLWKMLYESKKKEENSND